MSDEIGVAGASVIVTGAGRGIGRAEALLLAQRGARVCVVDLGASVDGSSQTAEDPAAETVADILAAGGEAFAVRASVADPEGVARIVDETVSAFGGIDALVCNAGNFAVHDFPEIDRATVQRFLDVHLFGSLELARAAWPHLARSTAPRIVNTVSSALWGVPGMVPYGSAKGAVLALTHNLAVAGAARGILVNAIAPGAGTRMIDATGDALPSGFAETMKQTMPAELVAPVAAFLASRDCAFTGEVLSASGGGVSRLVTVRTPGIRDPHLTPEGVRDRIDAILDLDGAKLHETGARVPTGAGRVLTEGASR
ncbi:SDR family NAD(P)-dependent oxidoreductase [Microbacterium sp. NPDC056044]|uniref:SDR family NAD(P)-dependent oxidoreductase n=1 Tax=Microbacterium sp. NPDC056044 TaxID=3345690 RepID=UPI0035DC1951